MNSNNTASAAVPAEFADIATICTATDILIGAHTVLGVADGRALHAGLGVGRDYTNWIKGRIAKYGFQAGVDFEAFDTPDLANQTRRGGDRRSISHRLTLDMAKELAMVENNEIGRRVRRYFIWLEKAVQPRQEPAMRDYGFDQWSNEELRTRNSTVTMYRQVMNNPSAMWMMERLGFPLPPAHLLPTWRQQPEMWAPPAANSVTITVGQVA